MKNLLISSEMKNDFQLFGVFIATYNLIKIDDETAPFSMGVTAQS